MAKAKRRAAISTDLRARIRREFFPGDFAKAIRTLAAWHTKRCAPGEDDSRMLRAVVTLALGSHAHLCDFIQAAEEDYRDVLWWSAGSEHWQMRQVACEPEPGPPNPEEEAFLTAIAKTPTDNVTRLVYADWLDERNDPRGAYVRVLVEWLTSRQEVDEEVFAREVSLRVGLSRAWLARIRGMTVRYVTPKRKRQG